jgi:hypothetical protein
MVEDTWHSQKVRTTYSIRRHTQGAGRGSLGNAFEKKIASPRHSPMIMEKGAIIVFEGSLHQLRFVVSRSAHRRVAILRSCGPRWTEY